MTFSYFFRQFGYFFKKNPVSLSHVPLYSFLMKMFKTFFFKWRCIYVLVVLAVNILVHTTLCALSFNFFFSFLHQKKRIQFSAIFQKKIQRVFQKKIYNPSNFRDFSFFFPKRFFPVLTPPPATKMSHKKSPFVFQNMQNADLERLFGEILRPMERPLFSVAFGNTPSRQLLGFSQT